MFIAGLHHVMIMMLLSMTSNIIVLTSASKIHETNKSFQLNNGSWISKDNLSGKLNLHFASNKGKNHSLLKRDVPLHNSGKDITDLLDRLLHEERYDSRLRPNYDGKPVVVQVGLWVIAIDSINVIDMDYNMDFYLRQLWYDPRLAHSANTTFTISNKILSRIWLPDTYFVNSKHSKFHKVTTENKLLSIRGDGLVHFNARVTVRPSCPMDLRMFPNDVQKCNLDIESYSYSENDVILVWENRSDGGIAIPPVVRNLPQHNITETVTRVLRSKYVSGNWSGIRAEITMKRKMGYFIIHVYSPCSLIVVLSWISFCIPCESTAARVTLGITSVLTTTTILNILNNSMPKVSYVKAIDWYLICCFLFVFGVLVEYTVILYVESYRQRQRRQTEIQKRTEKEKKAKEEASRPFNEGQTKTQTFARIKGENEVHTFIDEKKKTKKKKLLRLKHYILNMKTSDIDELARIFFPIMFMNFNLIYWLLFLS